MRNVTQEHILGNAKPLVNSYDDFAKEWRNRNFRPTFEKVIEERLTENQRIVLDRRYRKNCMYADIADELEISTARAQQIDKSAIKRLADISIYKELLIGSERFSALMDEKRKELDKALYHNKPDEMNLSCISLKGRAYNLLAKAVMLPRENITARMVIDKVDDLTDLNGCGILNAVHIIERFKTEGIDVSKWEENLKKHITTPALEQQVERYKKLDEKRKYYLVER